MLARRYSACTLAGDLLPNLIRDILSDVRASRLRWERDGRDGGTVRVDQRALTRVPRREQLRRGRGADEARVRHAREAHPGDVPRRGVDAVEVPDRLRGSAVELAGCSVHGGEDHGLRMWAFVVVVLRTEQATTVLELEDALKRSSM